MEDIHELIRSAREDRRELISEISRHGGSVSSRGESSIDTDNNEERTMSIRHRERGSGDFLDRPEAVPGGRRPLANILIRHLEDDRAWLNWHVVSIIVVLFVAALGLLIEPNVENSYNENVIQLIYKIHSTHEGLKRWAAERRDQQTTRKLMEALDELYKRHMDDLEMFKWKVQNQIGMNFDCKKNVKGSLTDGSGPISEAHEKHKHPV